MSQQHSEHTPNHTKSVDAVIVKDMMIGEVVAQYPEVTDVFLSYGLHCVGCHVNAYESIAMGAMGHGMTEEEVDEMVDEANRYLAQVQMPREGFSITPKAIEKLKILAAEEGKTGWGLRIEVQTSGCSDFRYNLEYEEKAKDGDLILTEGYTIFMDAESRSKLEGAMLDYVEGLNGSGFKVDNPNKKSCSCGKNSN